MAFDEQQAIIMISRLFFCGGKMNIASVFQGIATIAWVGFIALLAMTFVRSSRGQPTKGLSTFIVILLVAALLLTTVGMGVVFLQADQYGVVISAFQPNGYRAQAL
jgi:hypothetical protein